jgi:hypothetical protein
MGYGFHTWPYAPIKPSGAGYTDKLGRPSTVRQDADFRDWEVALLSAWGATVLLALIALPFYNSSDRSHAFE